MDHGLGFTAIKRAPVPSEVIRKKGTVGELSFVETCSFCQITIQFGTLVFVGTEFQNMYYMFFPGININVCVN